MKLFFVTTMLGAPWGGSEELWQQTALRARQHGNHAAAAVYKTSMGHARVLELQKAEIPVHPRSFHTSISARMMTRYAINIPGISPYKLDWERDEIKHSDLIVVSMGGTFDFLDTNIYRFLASTAIPFVLLVQFNYEHKVLSTEEIAKARPVIAKARRLFFVAQRNLDVCRRQLAIDLPNAEVVYNPMKVQQAGVRSFPNLHGSLQLACVARLAAQAKGQDILLQTLQGAKWKARDFRLRFYGSGPDDQYLRELILFYGLGSKCEIAGHVESIEQVWSENHALVLASIGEGTPLALIEAMAAGRPAVVTDVGDNAAWVEDNLSGFVAPAPTVPLLDEALERLWQSRELLEEMGTHAQAIYRAKFPPDPVGYFYERLLAVADKGR